MLFCRIPSAQPSLTPQALRRTGFLVILFLAPRLIVSLQKASDFVECFRCSCLSVTAPGPASLLASLTEPL